MLRVGHNLDGAIWTGAARRSRAYGGFGRLLSVPPTGSHPLAGVIAIADVDAETRAARTLDFCRGADPECPHHCPSVVRARGYRWACVSSIARGARRRAETQTMTAIVPGRIDGPECLPADECSDKYAAIVYRGDISTASGRPHGIGMMVFCKLQDLFPDMCRRQVGTWVNGRLDGPTRQWTGPGQDRTGKGHYIDYVETCYFEGFFRAGVRHGFATEVNANSSPTLITESYRRGRYGGGVTRSTRALLVDGRTAINDIDPQTGSIIGDRFLLTGSDGALLYRGPVYRSAWLPDGNYAVVYGTGDRIAYKGTMRLGAPMGIGSLFLRDGTTLRATSECRGWVPYGPFSLAGNGTVVMSCGDTVNATWPTDDDVRGSTPTVTSFVPAASGVDAFAATIKRVTEWTTVPDSATVEGAPARSATGRDRVTSRTLDRSYDLTAFFFWPRPGSPLGRECLGATAAVTRQDALDFVDAMAGRYPRWERCRPLVRSFLPATP